MLNIKLRSQIILAGAMMLSIIVSSQGTVSAGFYKQITVVSGTTRVNVVDSYGTTSGGEFTVRDVSNTAHPADPAHTENLFQTFCVELNGPGIGTAFVGSATAGRSGIDFASDITKGTNTTGGKDGMRAILDPPTFGNAIYNTVGSTNFLTYGAAALYKQFALGFNAKGNGNTTTATGLYTFTGLLAGTTYNFQTSGTVTGGNNSRVTDANLLQKAIWYFQGQSLGSEPGDVSNNKYVKAVQNYITNNGAFADLSAAAKSRALLLDVAGVKMMNLATGYNSSTGKFSNNIQSQLYWDGTPPQSNNPVPEPASIAMWLTMATFGGYVRRRRCRVC